MSYRKEFKAKDLTSSFVPEATREEIKQAMDTGKKVEWEYSSFEDPGDDWQQVVVDGKPVQGTHHFGY